MRSDGGWRTIVGVAVAAALAVGCTSDEEDPPSDSGPLPMMWLVGSGGTMLRLSDGDVRDYALDVTADLHDLACRGTTYAWAVGDDGVLVRTDDGGARWETLAPPVDGASLRAVAAAHRDVVYVVGDGGAMAVSRDSGNRWERVATPALDLLSVSTTGHGRVALVVAEDGSIWRHELGGSLDRVREASTPRPRAAALSDAGDDAVAVGEQGLLLVSGDGGVRWGDGASGTARDLHAVQISGSGDQAIAVGEAGVVVRVAPDGSSAREWLADGRSLRAVHLSSTGRGAAVGDRGTVLTTTDFGARWTSVGVGTDRDLAGIDDLGSPSHF